MSLESSEDRKERRRRAREAARDKALAQTGRTTPQVIGRPPEMEVPSSCSTRDHESYHPPSPQSLELPTLLRYPPGDNGFMRVLNPNMTLGWRMRIFVPLEEDVSLRASALNTERNLIIQPHVPPRRVWDLFSNRVVPSWTITGRIAAISHSWMSPELRHEVVTPINSREWPVPIPINTALERIRIELLNYGLEYVWLDVLCLRQVGLLKKKFSQEVDNVFPVLVAMRHRAAVNELDKIAGLAYLLRSPALPAYIPTQSPEDAWRRLIETMQARYRGDLLFLYPHPGDGRYVWCPSWRQVKETTLPKRVFLFEAVQYDEENGVYRHRGYRLERCFLKGLAEIGGETLSPRTGRIVVMEASNMHEFPVVALHTQCIPEDYYTLIGNQGHECWVVGRADNLGRVEKVTVIRMIVSGGDALKRLGALDPGRWENVEYN
ncbi:hypothetical protein BDZ89DRAFT_1160070 [Hymenopellis radicata]|nr:hypothetical protein BDZ89DRAFT_1160070 [Hymenopellis radicata]